MQQPHARGWFQVQDVLDAARGRWEQVLGSLGVRTELLQKRHGPCPGCGGRDRFRFDDKDGEGTFICSQGGGGNLSGNGLTLLQHCTGWDFKRSIEELGQLLLRDDMRVGWRPGMASAKPVDELPVDELPDEPQAEQVEIPKYNEQVLRDYVAAMPKITREDLKRISPIPVDHAVPGDFFEALYADNERLLVFTEFYSQGNFLYQVGSGSCRLGAQKGVAGVVSPLPTRGREGVWFLCNPVHGNWEPTEKRRVVRAVADGQHGPPLVYWEAAKSGRRSWQNVTTFRYAVLESDNAPEDLWIKALVKLPMPIVAIYSSGGKSLHALVRIDAGDKLTWDRLVRGTNARTSGRTMSLMSLVCPLGADPNALTAVRLTRLPFCMREGTSSRDQGYIRYQKPRLQELIYLRSDRLDQPAEWKSLELRHGGGKR